ncbi:MAG: hypothetical protein U9N53_00320 [Bacteroidota bacterium]|nr:hypothetical protein [Bacteroidota bacterium]
MKRNFIVNFILICVFGIILLIPLSVSGQEATIISKPELSFSNDTLLIKYNFENCQPNQLYTVWIEATTFDGEELSDDFSSLSGDIGNGVICNKDKVIYWDLAADSIFIVNLVYVKVMAKAEEVEIVSKAKHPNYFFPALMFPGSGLTLLKKNKKPYWIMGIAGYAGLASTLYFNEQANADYRNYEQEADEGKRQEYYDSYEENKKIMQISAISTGVIWATNLVWTLVAANHKPASISINNKELQITPMLFPEKNIAGLSLKYSF